MRLSFSETLSGGVYPIGTPRGAQASTLELVASARGLLDSALGAPFAIHGTLRAEPATTPEAALLPREAIVVGTMRFLLSTGLFYDLRVAPRQDAPPAEQLEIRGARRFVRGDLVASATTFDGVLARRGEEVGAVRLRFDARDDVPRLVRSLRLG